jgi:hypothetical protein
MNRPESHDPVSAARFRSEFATDHESLESSHGPIFLTTMLMYDVKKCLEVS